MASPRFIFTLFCIAISINQFNGGRLQVNETRFYELNLLLPSFELQDHFYLDYMLCKVNPKFSMNSTCKLSFINRLEKSLTVSNFVIDPIDNVMGRVQLYYKFRSGYKPMLVDVTCNLCDFFKGAEESKVMNLLIPKLQTYAGRNFTCPYQGIFTIKNMPINMGIFDYLFIPAGSYMLNLILRLKQEFFWNGKLYFFLPEGKTTDDDRMG